LTPRERGAYDADIMPRFAFTTRKAVLLTVVVVSGCQKSADSGRDPHPAHPATVRLVVVDDPALAKAIGRVKGEWKARSGADLEIRESTFAEISAAKKLGADAVIYPGEEMSTLAERRIVRPLPAEWLDLEEFHKADLFEPAGLAGTRWGEQTYAVPFGSPVFVLIYRRDVLERFHREPPRTWTEYDQLIESLSGHAKELPELRSVAVEPLGAGWASKVLLARAAAYAKHRDYYSTLFDKDTMQPQIALPPFVRALEELVAAAKPNAAASLAATPADARQAILAGNCALAITWPTAAKESVAEKKSKATNAAFATAIAFAELPGAADVYNSKAKSWETNSAGGESRNPSAESRTPLLGISGRLGSVVTDSQSGQFAFQLLAWLSGNEWGAQVCPASPATTLFRRSQVSQPGRWLEPEIPAGVAKQYAGAVADSLSRSQWLECPRIPGHAEYMAALDEAVRAVLEGKHTPAAALARAADRWREVTARLGAESQRTAYIRSLGLEP
jgi:ABC-type glycerol-3-phosphate transport system substrate-binding protein